MIPSVRPLNDSGSTQSGRLRSAPNPINLETHDPVTDLFTRYHHACHKQTSSLLSLGAALLTALLRALNKDYE